MEQGCAMGIHNCETPQRWESSRGQNWAVSLQFVIPVLSVTELPKSCVSVVHISSAAKFQRFTETKLFAQFDKDVQSVKKMSLKFSTGNVFKPKYKLRVLRIRLTPVEGTERYEHVLFIYWFYLLPFCFRFSKYCSLWLHRPLCRYDLVLEESKEVTFRPIPCEESNFWEQIWPYVGKFSQLV